MARLHDIPKNDREQAKKERRRVYDYYLGYSKRGSRRGTKKIAMSIVLISYDLAKFKNNSIDESMKIIKRGLNGQKKGL